MACEFNCFRSVRAGNSGKMLDEFDRTCNVSQSLRDPLELEAFAKADPVFTSPSTAAETRQM